VAHLGPEQGLIVAKDGKEEPMTEHGAQYDHIGSKYDEYARTATLKRAESYTFFRMVGAARRTACPGSGLRLRLLYPPAQATRRGTGGRRRCLARDDPPCQATGASRAARCLCNQLE
jgi:hypothetical protein